MKVRELTIGTVACAIGAAASAVQPYSVDAGSWIQAEAIGSNNPFVWYGAAYLPITGPSQFVNTSKHNVYINQNGFLAYVVEMSVGWYQYGPGVQVGLRGGLRFTPLVPNLSYTFNGFMNIVQTGSPASSTATSLVTLKPYPSGTPVLYANGLSFPGPGPLWTPSTPFAGTQSGNLTMGVQYELLYDFTLVAYHGGDTAMDYSVKLKNNPFFQMLLFQRPCQGDLNGDGYVDDSDFVVFATAYNIFDCADPLMPAGCPSDLNGDGYVDDTDFVIFAGMYENLLCP